jgi:hypothetical protein
MSFHTMDELDELFYDDFAARDEYLAFERDRKAAEDFVRGELDREERIAQIDETAQYASLYRDDDGSWRQTGIMAGTSVVNALNGSDDIDRLHFSQLPN